MNELIAFLQATWAITLGYLVIFLALLATNQISNGLKRIKKFLLDFLDKPPF